MEYNYFIVLKMLLDINFTIINLFAQIILKNVHIKIQ
jgi:hypothetical protein